MTSRSHGAHQAKQTKPLALEQEVNRIDLLFRQNVAGWIAVMINSAAYLYLSWGQISAQFLVPWYLVLNASAIARFFAMKRWDRVRSRVLTPQQIRPWRTFIFSMLLISGACWGAIGWQFGNGDSALHQVFTSLLIAGMTAGALASYAPSLAAMYAVLLPAMIPWITRMLLMPESTHHVMAALAVLYTVLMARLGKNLNRYVNTSLRLSVETAQLASDFEREVHVKENALEALSESEETLRMALESSGAMAWSWDVQDDRFVFQGNTKSVTGLGSFHGGVEEALAHIHPDDRKKIRCRIEEAVRTGGNIHADIRQTSSDGSLHYLVIKGQTAMRTPEGRAARMMGICLDVTAEKKQEIVLRERDIFEAANKAKSVFLANASHEIRTPLAAINGFAETLLQESQESENPGDGKVGIATRYGRLREETKRDVQVILRNGKYLASLVNDLLDLSKIETGRLYIQNGQMSPKREIEDSVQLIKPLLDEKELGVEIRYLSPMPDTVETDSLRFRQILLNLLSNSAKFTDKGRVEVRVGFEFECVEREGSVTGGMLKIAVVDTGIGLSDRARQNLFQPFARGETVEVQRVQGSGLGLALSRSLARCLGGDLRLLSSIPGGGSVFEFTVGVKNASVFGTVPAKESQEAPKEDTVMSELGGARILVVDDAADLRILMSRYLKRKGAEVSTCDNGAEAVAIAEFETFDAILMDIKMPIMDGYAATKTLRKKGYARPIIALTAHASADDRKMCIDVGCDGYLSKPVEFGSLMEMLKSHLLSPAEERESQEPAQERA